MSQHTIAKCMRILSISFFISLFFSSGAYADKQIKYGEFEASLPGKLISNPAKIDWKVQGGENLEYQFIDVPEIPGQKAHEMKVLDAQVNAWEVEMNTNLGKGVKRGDVILMAFWARVEEVNPTTGGARILARLSRNEDPWDAIISQVVIPTDEWRLYYIKGVAPADLNKKLLNVYFQVGDLEQTVQIGEFYVMNSKKGDINSIPTGSQDLSGNFKTDVKTYRNSGVLPTPEKPPEGPDFHPQDSGWSLVWSDEFSGDALDGTKWKPEQSCWGGGNQELQCYTDSEKNVQVKNGQLRLIALAETVEGTTFPPELQLPPSRNKQPFSSGKVRTRGLADWKYGRFEMRAKLPKGQGTWPAFWMLPTDNVYGVWPLSGEIDILESVNLGANCPTCPNGVEDRTSSALHFGDLAPKNDRFEQRTRSTGGENPGDGFHVFAAEWGEGLIKFFVDGELHMTALPENWYTAAPEAEGRPYAPFDQDFYLMLNLAIGGSYPSQANESGVAEDLAPVEFLVDWVRVYECAEDAETGLACMK